MGAFSGLCRRSGRKQSRRIPFCSEKVSSVLPATIFRLWLFPAFLLRTERFPALSSSLRSTIETSGRERLRYLSFSFTSRYSPLYRLCIGFRDGVAEPKSTFAPSISALFTAVSPHDTAGLFRFYMSVHVPQSIIMRPSSENGCKKRGPGTYNDLDLAFFFRPSELIIAFALGQSANLIRKLYSQNVRKSALQSDKSGRSQGSVRWPVCLPPPFLRSASYKSGFFPLPVIP